MIWHWVLDVQGLPGWSQVGRASFSAALIPPKQQCLHWFSAVTCSILQLVMMLRKALGSSLRCLFWGSETSCIYRLSKAPVWFSETQRMLTLQCLQLLKAAFKLARRNSLSGLETLTPCPSLTQVLFFGLKQPSLNDFSHYWIYRIIWQSTLPLLSHHEKPFLHSLLKEQFSGKWFWNPRVAPNNVYFHWFI